jgi:hypothetical protein
MTRAIKLTLLLCSTVLFTNCNSPEPANTLADADVETDPDAGAVLFEVPEDSEYDFKSPSSKVFSFAGKEKALKQLLGEWEAVSKNHQSICGDMTIDTATITFANKGEVTFQTEYLCSNSLHRQMKFTM